MCITFMTKYPISKSLLKLKMVLCKASLDDQFQFISYKKIIKKIYPVVEFHKNIFLFEQDKTRYYDPICNITFQMDYWIWVI